MTGTEIINLIAMVAYGVAGCVAVRAALAVLTEQE